MKCDFCGGPVKNRKVIYTLEYEGRLHIVEHVPARECQQCGEKLFSPETVDRIQKAIWQERKPDRIIEAPVIDYASI